MFWLPDRKIQRAPAYMLEVGFLGNLDGSGGAADGVLLCENGDFLMTEDGFNLAWEA